MGPSGAWEVLATLEPFVMLDHLGGTRHSEAGQDVDFKGKPGAGGVAGAVCS